MTTPLKGVPDDNAGFAARTPQKDNSNNGPANRYSMKKSKVHMNNRITDINTFLSIAADYIQILVKHDEYLKKEPWYALWLVWMDEGILNKSTLHVVSVIVDLPPTSAKSNKSVGTYILAKLTVLNRY